MNYQKHYDLLIAKSKNRLIEGYTEKHHIIPKCFGGTDDKENIAILTAREHFIAHILLYKIQTSKRKKNQMLKACIMFKSRDGSIKNSKLYEAARVESGRIQSLLFSGKNHPMYGVSRYGVDNPFYGKTHTEETRQQLSKISKNKVVVRDLTTGEILKVTKEEFDNNQNFVGLTSGHKLTEEHKHRCGNSARGKIYITNGFDEKRIFEDELKEYVGYKKGRLLHECIYCGKKTDRNNLKRWHNENCKNN